MKKPIIGELKNEDKFIFYKYRYYLSQDSQALIYFLSSINWQHPKESKEGINLMRKWTSITFEDTLYLLSSNFCCNEYFNKKSRKPMEEMRLVRQYAVENLEKTVKDQQIISVLLQLVQALRYECYDIGRSKLG